ncbi:MAG: undecaprenyldiphospho-muramoylpentapeptide beta-N-acetylglucosaminyltransferase [Treponema sp.]|nr:undecaprenyldiphospho-muramoylpentapeptide beta-N-acetylglucosaminyltransferase [Treponema sp.]
MKKINSDFEKIVFAGGGTGGHIYPGLAVCDALRVLCREKSRNIKIYWIGNSKGMDRDIVSKNVDADGKLSADVFYGIPSGKLRRYFSFRNFLDLFNIFAGLIASLFILAKIKPSVLFSKGGFVSVPPCLAAKILGIPVYTHECDFTPGLATKINSRSASSVFVSYEETRSYLSASARVKAVVTGNPVRPVFYSASEERGRAFLGLGSKPEKPVLFVQGGSLGARQINALIHENLEWLCSRFIVVHQTGAANKDQSSSLPDSDEIKQNYKPYPFIYKEMPDVMAAGDIILSRAGANSIWESSVLGKPMILVPLCGNGTRGDQEDNASYFEKSGAAIVLARENATSEKLREALQVFLDENKRAECSKKSAALSEGKKPAEKIASILYEKIYSGEN